MRASSVAVALLIAAATLHAQPDAAGRTRLETLGQTSRVAGAAIYQGAVFAQTPGVGKPLFSYERHVAVYLGGLSAAHITRDPSGALIIVEEARFTSAYALQRFEASNLQAGFSGSVKVSKDGTHLEYSLSQNGEVTKAAEEVSDPVVTGPTLHGFVLQHWDALADGQLIAVHMIVLAGVVIARMKVSFDMASRALLRYEGRVPPMQAEGGKLKSLDARVEYTMQVLVYR